MLETFVYISSAVGRLADCDLKNIVGRSQHKNAIADLTGILLYEEGAFLQVLEGETADIDQLIGRLNEDNRHSNMIVLYRNMIAKRAFPDWAMGFAKHIKFSDDFPVFDFREDGVGRRQNGADSEVLVLVKQYCTSFG